MVDIVLLSIPFMVFFVTWVTWLALRDDTRGVVAEDFISSREKNYNWALCKSNLKLRGVPFHNLNDLRLIRICKGGLKVINGGAAGVIARVVFNVGGGVHASTKGIL